MHSAPVTRAILWGYFASIGFYTLLNNSGTAPASLAVVVLLALVLGLRLVNGSLRTPRFSLIDILMLGFLFVSTCSVLVSMASSRTLNLNHLYAHFAVILLYYFVFRWALASLPPERQTPLVIGSLHASFILITLTVAVDYGFLLQGVNIADFVPMEKANKVAGSGVFSRPRGFFVEPTDLGLALNALTPIILVRLHLMKRRVWFAVTLLLFLTIHMLARSAAALAGLAAGVMVAGFDAVLRARVQLVVSRGGFKNFLVLGGVLAALFVAFKDVITYNIASMTIKLFTVEQSASSSQRHEAWQDTIDRFLDGPNHITGYGTGFLSARSNSSLSWFLSVLTENGVLGILVLALVIGLAMLRLMNMPSKMRYGFYIAIIAVCVHLMSNSGFYYPFLWLLLVLIQLDWPTYENKSRSVYEST